MGDDKWSLLKDLLENWKSFLEHLTFEQLGAVVHFSTALFIFSCLLNIIATIYSGFLLDYLKLETKYPKIARFIKLRRKFQQYYLFIYFTFIILTLIAIMFINLKLFISS